MTNQNATNKSDPAALFAAVFVKRPRQRRRRPRSVDRGGDRGHDRDRGAAVVDREVTR